MRKLFLILFFAASSLASSAQVCKPNQYDMLQWMLPWQSIQNSHYDVLYPSTGTFYWVKGSKGYPWDVDLFDDKYVYQSITENVWSNPSTFKIFETPRPWAPRCIDIPAVPGKIASIPHDASQTWYDMHSSCTSFTRHNLLNAINEVWGPFSVQVGALPAAPTLTLSYRYGCDSNYGSCHFKETFELQQGSGLVRWTYYKLNAGQYVVANQTVDTTPLTATVTPVHPCW